MMFERYMRLLGDRLLRLSERDRLLFGGIVLADLYLRLQAAEPAEHQVSDDIAVGELLVEVLEASEDPRQSVSALARPIAELFPDGFNDGPMSYYFGIGVALMGLLDTTQDVLRAPECVTWIARPALEVYLARPWLLPEVVADVDATLVDTLVGGVGSDAYEDMAVPPVASQLRLLDDLDAQSPGQASGLRQEWCNLLRVRLSELRT